jgi:succinyl-diaminopimelate desuccinylase
MIELLKNLIRAESTAQKGELEAAKVISSEFNRYAVPAELHDWDGSRANLIAHVKSTGAKPALLFVAHLDVVPAGDFGWNRAPFEPLCEEGRIYGRGAADMKGGIAAVITAICQLVEQAGRLQGDIVFLASAGEETDSCGTKKFIAEFAKDLPPLAGVIIPEPTDFDIVTAHRGILWLKVTAKGKTAHGSTPQLGVNAINSISLLLNELRGHKIPHSPHPVLGGCSMSINRIYGGSATNIIPEQCTIEIDIRTLPGLGHKEIVSDLEEALDKLSLRHNQFSAELGLLRDIPALETDGNSPFVKAFCAVTEIARTRAVGFTTDGPHFARLGLPVVIFGPGKPNLAHKPDEYIDLADLEKAVDYYKKIILHFLT